MTWLRLVLAVGVLLAANLPAYAAKRDLADIRSNVSWPSSWSSSSLWAADPRRRTAITAPGSPAIKFILGVPLTWLVLALIHAKTGLPASEWIAWPLWIVLVLLFLAYSQNLVPGIPNLLNYPGSAFVLDFKGENYAVTARAAASWASTSSWSIRSASPEAPGTR